MLEGRVGEFGFARLSGAVNVYAPRDRTTFRVELRNIDLPTVSPYSMRFAGYRIAEGRATLDLNYRVRGAQIEGDNLVAHVQAIALTAQTALKSFEPKVQGGESKTEVWAQWPDFEKKMKDFAVGTAKLVDVAKAGGANAVNEAMVDALTCKGCHDTYKKP